MRRTKTCLQILLILPIMLSFACPSQVVTAFQDPTSAEEKAAALLSLLSTEQKIGQLFLVTFQGTEVGPSSQIYDLVVNHYIGGVVFTRDNGNFDENGNLLSALLSTIYSLQSNAWNVNPVITDDETPQVLETEFIPLFVGISQEGDLYPTDQILSGVTALPNQMAIGATWSEKIAFEVGSVLGKELNFLGFNLLLGPSLDVVEVSTTEASGNKSSRSFGGDPYWVGLLGQSYISGVHLGSEGKMMVVAKHFPGGGGSDRSVEREVATVRKSLEQLKQIELAPFFAVTGSASDSASEADGLLVSHIRYQGFQGNIRATTRPVSFDATALNQILAIDTLATWRESGGILVSDDLGSEAVKRFFDTAGSSFDANQVARSAFLAGNDLLYVDQFISTADPDAHTTIVRTLDYFVQKYNEDDAFADRVDESVKRLLTQKYSMYPNFMLSEVLPRYSNLNILALTKTLITDDIAKKAATLISPSKEELEAILPETPQFGDKIVFISDTRTAQQCESCEVFDSPGKDFLANAVMKLYGPSAGGQIRASDISTYSFEELNAYLESPGEWVLLDRDLNNADWIVVSTLDWDPDQPASQAFKRFLGEKDNLLKFKQLIVFAFNAPVFLDSTEISKLSAFYGMYSKQPAFFDVAARLLFQELSPLGSSPVSIPGAGYDLNLAVSPDPDQIISLIVDSPVMEPEPSDSGTPQATAAPFFGIGDSIPIRTGVILDNNQHAVPDGTVVKFTFTTTGETFRSSQVETITSGGIARTSYLLQDNGLLEVRVTCDPAINSTVLQMNISEGQVGMITQIAPTAIVTPTAESVIDSEPSPTAEDEDSIRGNGLLRFSFWLVNTLFSCILAWGIYRIGARFGMIRWGLRWALIVVILSFVSFLTTLLLKSENQYFWIQAFLIESGYLIISVVIGLVWFWVEKKTGT